nr:MAG TPA: hypothetical protein [Crassvirales sp.]
MVMYNTISIIWIAIISIISNSITISNRINLNQIKARHGSQIS